MILVWWYIMNMDLLLQFFVFLYTVCKLLLQNNYFICNIWLVQQLRYCQGTTIWLVQTYCGVVDDDRELLLRRLVLWVLDGFESVHEFLVFLFVLDDFRLGLCYFVSVLDDLFFQGWVYFPELPLPLEVEVIETELLQQLL